MPSEQLTTLYCTCIKCGVSKRQPSSKFYKSSSTLYSNDEFMPICKKHLLDLFSLYEDQLGTKRRAMKRICMAFDIYYSDILFDEIKSDNNGQILNSYMKKVSAPEYKNKTYDTTILEGTPVFEGEPEVVVKEKIVRVTDKKSTPAQKGIDLSLSEDVEKWGPGLDATDYEILNSHYKLLKTANPNCDSNQEIFINDLCYTKMQQLKSVREGRVDDYNKLTESYRKTFSQAGLKTVQESAQDADACWGVWTGNIAQYTPEEYYADKQLYADWDKIGDYYDRMVVRPLRNLQLGTTDRDDEFYVHDSDGDSYE